MRNKWTEEELKILEENYNKLSSKEIAKLVNKTYQAVNSKIGYYKYISQNLPVPGSNKYKENSINEYNNFLDEYKDLNDKELKTIHKVHKKPNKKIYANWTEEEISFLKENYKNMTNDQLALKLGKTINHIKAKLRELKLYKTIKRSPANKWTEDENNFLIDLSKINYLSKYEKFKLALKTLNRTKLAIIRQIKKLGLEKEISHKNGSRSQLEEKIDQILLELNINYEAQYLIPNSLYRCDFYIEDKNTIIEIYGDFWHKNPNKNIKKINLNKKDDKEREQFIINLNYNLIIIWEDDINNNIEKVYNILKSLI